MDKLPTGWLQVNYWYWFRDYGPFSKRAEVHKSNEYSLFSLYCFYPYLSWKQIGEYETLEAAIITWELLHG